MDLIWFLIIILIIAAFAGGLGVSPWFWILLIIALILFVRR